MKQIRMLVAVLVITLSNVFPSAATSRYDTDRDDGWLTARFMRVNDEARVLCIAGCLALGATPFVGPMAAAACVAACPLAIRK